MKSKFNKLKNNQKKLINLLWRNSGFSSKLKILRKRLINKFKTYYFNKINFHNYFTVQVNIYLWRLISLGKRVEFQKNFIIIFTT